MSIKSSITAVGVAATVLAFAVSGGVAPAQAGWKLCVSHQCDSGYTCNGPRNVKNCTHHEVCRNVLVDCTTHYTSSSSNGPGSNW
jgi:hypothetical protein